MMLLRCLTVSIVGMLTLLLAAPAAAQPVKLASESYHVPARDPGIQLYVRNKRPEAMTTFTPDRILLFVHGATYPAETTFDLPSTAYRGWTTSLNAATTLLDGCPRLRALDAPSRDGAAGPGEPADRAY